MRARGRDSPAYHGVWAGVLFEGSPLLVFGLPSMYVIMIRRASPLVMLLFARYIFHSPDILATRDTCVSRPWSKRL